MRIRFQTLLLTVAPALLLATALSGFAQNQQQQRSAPPYSVGQRTLNDDLRSAAFGHYLGSPVNTPFANGQSIDDSQIRQILDSEIAQHQLAAPSANQLYVFFTAPGVTVLAEIARRNDPQPQSHQSEYDDYKERKRQRELRAQSAEPQVHADPEAPDQSELLRNSKDHDFILHNFRTMYIDASEAKFFSSDLVKAALGRSKDFQKLKVRIVDDPRVADAVLKITYSFAWDYPFELRHQNTTYVLLAGKGEGPFYGPLGAADVARQFVNAAKPWREEKKAK